MEPTAGAEGRHLSPIDIPPEMALIYTNFFPFNRYDLALIYPEELTSDLQPKRSYFSYRYSPCPPQKNKSAKPSDKQHMFQKSCRKSQSDSHRGNNNFSEIYHDICIELAGPWQFHHSRQRVRNAILHINMRGQDWWCASANGGYECAALWLFFAK
jgi:hypothetical protein